MAQTPAPENLAPVRADSADLKQYPVPATSAPIPSSLASIIGKVNKVQPYLTSAFHMQPTINSSTRTDKAPRFTSPLGDPPEVKNIVARQLNDTELVLPRRPSTELRSVRVGVQARVGFGAHGFDSVAYAARVFLTTNNNDLPTVAAAPDLSRYRGPLVVPARWLSKLVPASFGWRVNSVPNLDSGAIEKHPDGGYRLKKVGEDAETGDVTLAAPLELTLLRQMALGTKVLRWMNFFPILPNAGYSSIESKKAKVFTLPKHIADMVDAALRNNPPEFSFAPERGNVQSQVRIKVAPLASVALPFTGTHPRPSHWDEFSNRVWTGDQTSEPRRSQSLQAGVRGGLFGVLNWQALVYAQWFKLQAPTLDFAFLHETPDTPTPKQSPPDQALANIETAWQAPVSRFLEAATQEQIRNTAADLKDDFPEVAGRLKAVLGLDSQAEALDPELVGRWDAEQTSLARDLVNQLLKDIPAQQAERLLEQPGMTPEQAAELVGILVQKRGVAAMVGYHLRELLETGAHPVAVAAQAAQVPQQPPPHGRLVKGRAATDRLHRLIGSFPPDGRKSNTAYDPAPHLEITHRPWHGVRIVPDLLADASRNAFDRLQGKFGKKRLDDMVSALVVGYVSKTGQEMVGLRALAEAWRDAAAIDPSMPPLAGSLLVDLGKVVFNQPGFGLLEHLQALVAVDMPKAGFRGLLHPTTDLNYVSRWIAPANDDLQQLRGLITSPLSLEQIRTSPWYLDYLRRAQRTYDSESGDDVWQQSPWHGSDDPGFKNTLAAREAFWLELWNAGLKDQAPGSLQSLELQHWIDAARVAPELEHIDFAGSFIEAHDNILQVLPQALVSYDSQWEPLQVHAEALRLSEETFSGKELRTKLRKILLVFEHAGALRLYGTSPDFERDAADLAVKQFAPDGMLPWVREQLIERASLIAKSEDFQLQAGVLGEPWLQALEVLATTDKPDLAQVRSDLVDQILLLQAGQTRLLENLGASLRDVGLVIAPPPSVRGAPMNSAAAQLIPSLRAETLDDAVLELLGRAGIKATLVPAVDGQPRQLLVEPLAGADVITDMEHAMDTVVSVLKLAGYPTTWQLRNTQATFAATNANYFTQVQQLQQQPQQAPTSDPEFDPNDPGTRSQEFRDRLPVGKRDHLGWQPDNSVSVIKDQLRVTPRAALDALVADLGGKNSGLGEYRLNLMLNALIMGYDGEIGLRALAKAWLAQAGDNKSPKWPTLTGTRLVRLAQVAFNDERASTLLALEALVGIDSPTYRGILHPEEDAKARQDNSLGSQTRAARGRFWRVLSDNGLPAFRLKELEAALKNLPPPGNWLEWAHVVFQYPWLANLDFAKIFGGQSAPPAVLVQAQSAPSRTKPRLNPAEDAAKLRSARSVAETTFKDPGLRDRLRRYLADTFPDEDAINAFAASEGLLGAATRIVLERLIEKSPLDHPKHVSALVSTLGLYVKKVAQERLTRLPEDSTIFNVLEHILLSPDADDTLHRNLLLRRMDFERLELSKNLLSELAEELSRLGIQRTYGRVAQHDTFPDALRVALGQFRIDARLERSTDDRTRTIVVTPWSWNSPTLDPALNQPLINAMDDVVDRLTQAGYPTQWKWADAPDPL
jgi:hypothetical protein